jgi:hypothetical protein
MELYLALAAIGLIALVAVVVFTYWRRGLHALIEQVRHLGRKAGEHGSRLVRRQDLPFRYGAVGTRRGPLSGGRSSTVHEPRLGAAAGSLDDFVADDLDDDSGPPSRRVDFWVRVPGDEPVDRDVALSVFRQHEYLLERPRRLLGKEMENGDWRDLERAAADTRFTDLIMTLQLVDRNGPVTDSEMTRFTNMVYDLSEKLDRRFRFHGEVDDALRDAVSLDEFCKEFDQIAVINVVPKGDRPFRGPEILEAAERAGLMFGDMDIFHYPDSDSGEDLFCLAGMYRPGTFDIDAMDAVSARGLTLFMNVPRIREPVRAFDQMVSAGRLIGDVLGAQLVDQNRQPLPDRAIDEIRRQIAAMAKAMAEGGVRPGGDVALRLF